MRYVGRVEFLPAGADYFWDGMKRPGTADRPIFCFQFTLAGWGNFELYGHGQAPTPITPGMGFVTVIPSRHRYYLPANSPGWTYGWLIVAHSYLVQRFSAQIELTGPILNIDPENAFVRRAVQLICSSYRKDIRDRFEVERALFELLIDFERLVQHQNDPQGERNRLLEAVRTWVLANPQKASGVDALADEHGMTRSNFSHFFRARTGLTPARVIAQARLEEATRLLVETRSPIKAIADACGFASANHFIRVFQRFKHASPGAYRKSIHRRAP